MKSLAIVIITDPKFVKNMIIKQSKTHKLKPNNEYLMNELQTIMNYIESQDEYYDDHLDNILELTLKLNNPDIKVILQSTIEYYKKGLNHDN